MIKPPYHDIKFSATISVPASLITTLLQDDSLTESLLQRLLRRQNRMEDKLATIAETIESVKATAADERAEVQAKIGELTTQIQELRDQIANGTQVTDEQLAELNEAVESILTPADTVPTDPEDPS